MESHKPSEMVAARNKLESLREERERVAEYHMELNQLVAVERAADDMKGYWNERSKQASQAVREQQA